MGALAETLVNDRKNTRAALAEMVETAKLEAAEAIEAVPEWAASQLETHEAELTRLSGKLCVRISEWFSRTLQRILRR